MRNEIGQSKSKWPARVEIETAACLCHYPCRIAAHCILVFHQLPLGQSREKLAEFTASSNSHHPATHPKKANGSGYALVVSVLCLAECVENGE
jgi:hypothetical protein